MDFAVAVYGVTRRFPTDEQFGLSIQVRRSAASVASNIAEGQGRSSSNELLHFLSIARGSLCEAQTQIMLASRLSYIDEAECRGVVAQGDEVGRLIRGLSRSIVKRLPESPARRPSRTTADHTGREP
jgi:four helix bundle protein